MGRVRRLTVASILETLRAIAQNAILVLPVMRRLSLRTHVTGIDGDPGLAAAAFDFLAERAELDGKTLLELGPGKTLEVLELARTAGANASAADIVPHLTLAGARARGIDHRLYPGRSLPWPDASFDVVFSYYSLQHVRWPDVTVREIARVLKPGGRLVCRVDLRDHYHMAEPGREYQCLKTPAWLWRLMTWNRGSYVNRLRCPAWIALFETAGLRVIRLDRHRNPALVAANRGHRYLRGLSDDELATFQFDAVVERPE